LDHREIATKFKSEALKQTPPDIIVAAFPTLGLCQACIEVGKKWNIPVLVDYRDMWPEVFIEIGPKFLKPFLRLLLASLFAKTKKLFSNASGIIGITEEFLQLGLSKINRPKNAFDGVFPLAYMSNQFSDSQFDNANEFWKSKLSKTDKLRIIFIGTLGHQFDLETVINAIDLLKNKGIFNFEIILCGSGDKESYLKNASLRLSNLYLPGYISAAQIKSLLLTADIGLCPYNVNQAFLSSIPGKAIEYMSAGLPILTTLENGELGKLCKEHGFGYFYEEGKPLSLANSIIHLIETKNKLNLLKENILSLYSTSFEAENVYLKYIQHLEKIVNK
jgi:glycosyltransferase involved in cell wall biosynthesis